MDLKQLRLLSSIHLCLPSAGAGYCFSASLPPFLATAALGALSYMEQGGQDQLEAVRRNAQLMRSKLAGSLTGAPPPPTLFFFFH